MNVHCGFQTKLYNNKRDWVWLIGHSLPAASLEDKQLYACWTNLSERNTWVKIFYLMLPTSLLSILYPSNKVIEMCWRFSPCLHRDLKKFWDLCQSEMSVPVQPGGKNMLILLILINAFPYFSLPDSWASLYYEHFSIVAVLWKWPGIQVPR